jgi:hypothetical protein
MDIEEKNKSSTKTTPQGKRLRRGQKKTDSGNVCKQMLIHAKLKIG